jgi:hypothetical protein
MEVIVHHAGSKGLPRTVVYAALVTALGIASLALSQCTQVSDTLTGVALSHGISNHCKNDCNRFFLRQEQQERRLHRENLRHCKSDKACVAAENARHQAEEDRLEQARKDCRANCHRQGGGHLG